MRDQMSRTAIRVDQAVRMSEVMQNIESPVNLSKIRSLVYRIEDTLIVARFSHLSARSGTIVQCHVRFCNRWTSRLVRHRL